VPSLVRVRPYNLIRELARRHEVSLLATGPGDELRRGAQLASICKRVDLVPLGLPGMAIGSARAAARGFPLQSGICLSGHLIRRLKDLLEAEDFDVVHVEHLRAAGLIEQVPRSVPSVFDSVDCISLLLQRTLRGSHSRWQRLIAALELKRTMRFEARMLSRFDSVTATSRDDAVALKALAPEEEVSVVPNGVDLAFFQAFDRPRDEATLLFSGKMSYHANVTAVLHFVRHILPLIRESRPDVRLDIVGSNPPRSVRVLSRDPGVRVTGFVPDMRESMSRATLAVCPVTVKVGIQNKVLEALAMRLPVVSTPQGVEGLPLVVGRDVLVGDTPAQFAAHVLRLLDDGPYRESLAARGRSYVELHHRWEAAARQLETCYISAQTKLRRKNPSQLVC
jgi:glycosyltransferase involved in cell wall biosynthesis